MDNKNLTSGLNKAKLLQAKAQYKLRTSNKTSQNSIYPWMNHDYDYQQHVKNNYTPAQMGISAEPCVDVTINDALNLPNYFSAALFDAIPNQKSKAGVDDVDPSNPEFTKLQHLYRNFKEPYPGFKKEYPEFFPQALEGENASSYFVRTGYCPTNIKSTKECTEKGYTWIPNPIKMPASTSKFFPGADTIKSMGGCQKPRYTYVNNKPGDVTGLIKGVVPTIGKDVLELNPISFMNIIMSGQSPSGDFTPLPCKEGFSINKKNKNNKNNIFIIIIVISIVILSITLNNI